MREEKTIEEWSTEDLQKFLKSKGLTKTSRKTIEDEIARRRKFRPNH